MASTNVPGSQPGGNHHDNVVFQLNLGDAKFLGDFAVYAGGEGIVAIAVRVGTEDLRIGTIRLGENSALDLALRLVAAVMRARQGETA